MVTYIKIGSCDEIKEWGKYDPIPATTECCCCGTTVIDIITPNKDTPIVVPDKPKEDTPTKPSENGSTDSGSTTHTTPSENTGNTTPSQPSENGGTDNGNVSPSTPSAPSENNGSTDSGDLTPTTPSENTGGTDNGNTSTTEPTTPSENNGNSDSGTSTKPSENNGSTDSGSVTPSQPSDNTGTTTPSDSGNVTPSNPSENNGSSDSGDYNTPANPSENNGNTGDTTPSENDGEGVISGNLIRLQNEDDGYSTLLEFYVYGRRGEEVKLKGFIERELNNNPSAGKLDEDGNFVKDGIVYVTKNGSPSIGNAWYIIKDDGLGEDFHLKPKQQSTT